MSDELSVKGRVNAFHQRHGPECHSDGAAIYYANGAVRDANPMGALIEPPNPDTPQKEWAVRSNQLQFYKLKLQKAVDEFDDLNTRLAYSVPSDPDGELAKLEKLAAVVEERKKLVATAEAALQDTRWGRQRAEARQHQQEQEERIAKFNQRRRAIRI
jgi:hypothetical protein